jgi:hypothetical protein
MSIPLLICLTLLATGLTFFVIGLWQGDDGKISFSGIFLVLLLLIGFAGVCGTYVVEVKTIFPKKVSAVQTDTATVIEADGEIFTFKDVKTYLTVKNGNFTFAIKESLNSYNQANSRTGYVEALEK